MEKIGHIKQIWRYPVKSMRGERLTQAYVSYAGILGDRVWAIVDDTNTSDFPWLTARQKADLLLFQPKFADSLQSTDTLPTTEDYAVAVTTPEGDTFGLDDPTLVAMMEQRFGRKLHLRFSEKSMHDNRPLSLLGMRTIHQLKEELDQPIDHLRFRQNFYIDWDERRGFYENELLGKALRIGQHVDVLINKLDERCKIISLNPATGQRDEKIQQHVVQMHDNIVGVYAVVLREGMVKAGDEIHLL